eukprot:2991299-Prymnesium_polylepis.3
MSQQEVSGLARHESEDSLFPQFQKNYTHETQDNMTPTKVPPPITALSGTLGQRHVICITGLPFSGQIPVAHLLKHYLEFMSGTWVKLFDVSDHVTSTQFQENRAGMLSAITAYLAGKGRADSSSAAQIRPLIGTVIAEGEQLENVDPGRVAIVFDSDARAHQAETWSASTKGCRRWIVDQLDTYRKSVSKTFVEV